MLWLLFLIDFISECVLPPILSHENKVFFKFYYFYESFHLFSRALHFYFVHIKSKKRNVLF